VLLDYTEEANLHLNLDRASARPRWPVGIVTKESPDLWRRQVGITSARAVLVRVCPARVASYAAKVFVGNWPHTSVARQLSAVTGCR
jgi:hypothetical protein